LQNSADPTTYGNVRYDWQANDVALVSLYYAWFIVVDPNTGHTARYPNDDTWLVEIVASP
jgi:hypothetical protein